MSERLAQLARQVRELWSQMPPRRRLLLGGAVGAVFVILAALSVAMQVGGGREVLFSNLSAADAAEVLRRLDERGLAYEIAQGPDGRATILVPAREVYRTRIDLAAEGLPRQGSVGFEIFDSNQLGMTDDVRRINLRRALSGELERTIRAIDAVADARVQVALPENRLFISQQSEPTAAVMVTLRPGARLSAEQVRAIQRLVGATIEGLSPDAVFVADNFGNPLSDQLAHLSSLGGVTSVEQQLLIQQAVSNEYSRQIRSLLEGPFGVGAVEAMVQVELNFEKAEEIIKAFEAPAGTRGVVRSEQRSEETFAGTGAPAGGVPGVESNIPGYPAFASSGDSEYSRFEEIVNYEVNETQIRREIPPGAVRRVSVAVLIDGSLSDEQEAAVAGMLTTALGLNAARGDQVRVDSMPFVSRAAPAAVAPTLAGERLWGVPYLFAALALAVVLVLALLLRTRRRAARGIDVVVGDEEEAVVRERMLSPEERRRQELHDQLVALARQNPDSVAQLLKSWLTEE